MGSPNPPALTTTTTTTTSTTTSSTTSDTTFTTTTTTTPPPPPPPPTTPKPPKVNDNGTVCFNKSDRPVSFKNYAFSAHSSFVLRIYVIAFAVIKMYLRYIKITDIY